MNLFLLGLMLDTGLKFFMVQSQSNDHERSVSFLRCVMLKLNFFLNYFCFVKMFKSVYHMNSEWIYNVNRRDSDKTGV